jgi:hypothetical protein
MGYSFALVGVLYEKKKKKSDVENTSIGMPVRKACVRLP